MANSSVHVQTCMETPQKSEKRCAKNPAIPKCITEVDTCSSMFITALSIRSRNWKQPRSLSIDGQVIKCGIFTNMDLSNCSEK